MDEAHVVGTFVDRTNIVYVAVFFMVGGLLFLYRDNLRNCTRVFRWINRVILLGSILVYYTVLPSVFILLVAFTSLTILAIVDGSVVRFILQNKVAHFINSISLEAYLCHMFVFRFFEKLVLNKIKLSGPILYWSTAVVVMIGAFIMAWIFQKVIEKIRKRIHRERRIAEVE